MKIAPFVLAGACTTAALSLPALRDAARLYLWCAGPALVFALVLAAVARRLLSRWQMAAVVLVALLAYLVGEVFAFQTPRLGLRLMLPFSPAVGAAGMLAGLVAVAGRSDGWVRRWLLGSLLALWSYVPLKLGEWLPVPGFFWWGVHILVWYVVVGHFALKLLAAGRRAAPPVGEGTLGLPEAIDPGPVAGPQALSLSKGS